jgi:hypothetical protein
MTTFTGFVAALGGLNVTGVTTELSAPPADLEGVNLPAQWVQLPEMNEPMMTFQTHGGWPALSGQLVIAYKSTAQATQSANWAGVLALIDALAAALRTVAPGTIGKGPLTWRIRPGVVTVAGTDYWAVIADVEAHG